jgi:hypothetical protein
MRPTVYIETSVVSYYCSRPNRDLIVAAHQQITAVWWEEAMQRYDAYVSAPVLDECARGDRIAAALRLERIQALPVLETSEGAIDLAEYYCGNLPIPDKARADCYHLALAVWHGMDYLVSWNMSHIVNGHVIKRVQELNAARSLPTPVICTPEELLEDA